MQPETCFKRFQAAYSNSPKPHRDTTMKSFTQITAIVAPLDRSNVDTDAIIPKQFLKSIKRSGFGVNCFDEWRYLDHGEPRIFAQPAALSRRADSAHAQKLRLRFQP